MKKMNQILLFAIAAPAHAVPLGWVTEAALPGNLAEDDPWTDRRDNSGDFAPEAARAPTISATFRPTSFALATMTPASPGRVWPMFSARSSSTPGSALSIVI